MSNQYFNFYYSPTRQGYDSSTWHTLFGNPVASGNKLLLSDAAMLHYGDIVRGDASFGLNIAAPAAGTVKKFGFYQPGKNAYAYFQINESFFTGECSNGTNTTSVAITWQSAWTTTNTDFRVQWEAGTVTFFVGGVQQAVIQDISVSGDPMSIYVANEAQDTITLNYIDVKSIQSFMMSEGNENAIFNEYLIYASSGVIVSESVSIYQSILVPGLGTPQSDVLALTESITIDVVTYHATVNDTLTTTESVSVTKIYNVSVTEAMTVTDVRTVGSPA